MRSGWTPTRKVSDGLVELEAIWEAQERIRPVAVRTPLYPSDVLSRELGSDVRLKLESLRRTGSFKFSGGVQLRRAAPRRPPLEWRHHLLVRKSCPGGCGRVETEGRGVVAVVSGGNVDPASLVDL